MKVTVLGGGNGIAAVLRGLAARIRSGAGIHVTAVVATADDGGSSGRLRRDRGGLPPGDIRNCLVALARDPDAPFARLFAHRYRGAGFLAGHALGNLVLKALEERDGSFLRATESAGEMLGACGLVMPVSLESVRLVGMTRDRLRLFGESTIGNSPRAVHRVWLEPSEVAAAPGVEAAVREADLLVLGPGSLFTSLLPVLLVPGLAKAMRACRGVRVLVANLMTQPGETLGMSLSDHLEALDRHISSGPLVEHVLVNSAPISERRMRAYALEGSEPVDVESANGRSERLVRAPLVSPSGKVRHDPDQLAAELLALAGWSDAGACRDAGVSGDAGGKGSGPSVLRRVARGVLPSAQRRR